MASHAAPTGSQADASARGKRPPASALLFATRVNLFAISLAALWIPLNLIVLPGQVEELVPSGLRGTGIGAVTFIGVGIAALVQPVAGRITDRAPLSDRRRPFMVVPALAITALLFALDLAPFYALLLLVYVAMQVLSNFAQAALQALIPDLVDERERGTASGVKTALDALGIVIGLAGVALLLSIGANSLVLVGFLALLIGGGGLLAWLLVPPVEPAKDRAKSFREFLSFDAVKEPFVQMRKADAAFQRAVLMRFLFLVGLFMVQRFLLYYLDERFGVERPEEQSSLYLLVGFALAAIGAGAAGWLSDLLGRKLVLRVSIVLASAMLVVLALAPVLAVALVAGAGIALAAGAFQAANWALLADSMEQQRGGEYFGLANLATAGSGALAGLFGPLVDVFNAFSPALTYAVLFCIAAAVTLSSLTITRKIAEAKR